MQGDRQQYYTHQQPRYDTAGAYESDRAYSPASYSYPPQDQQHEQHDSSEKSPNHLDAGHRSYSDAYSDNASAYTRAPSSYDEKGLNSSSTALAAVESHDNNNKEHDHDDNDYIPPAVPRPQQGRHGHSTSSVHFTPGHVSRGSVALLAAAEGKIPKKEGLKMWRSDEHHGTFTAGGKRRTALRCCCCTLVLAFILVVGVVASFLLWVRPPNVQFEGVNIPQDGLTVSGSGFNLNLQLDIAVSNPNFFGASFKRITAKAFYPTNPNQAVGGGQMDNVKIPANSHNKLFFPFALNYTKSIDPSSTILLDIATKCGFVGDAGRTDISVNYDLTLGLQIAGITISPTFRSSTSFACPLSQSDVQGLLGGAGSGLLGGGGGS